MKAAYTLIELVIAVAIISVIFIGIGVAGFRDFGRRQGAASVARTVISDLRLAQKLATSGRKPTGCSGVLNGFTFTTINPSGSNCLSYRINASCGGVIVNPPERSYDLPSGIVLNCLSSSILFKSISAGTNIPAGSSVTLTITDTANNITQPVNISETGEIK